MIGIHEGKNTISKKVDPSALKNAIEAYNCFELYNKNVDSYAVATAYVPQSCE